MPGNVVLAHPTTILPYALCTLFERQKQWDMRVNWFCDGSHVRSPLVASDRSSWTLAHKLSAAQMNTLYAFYLARRGSYEPFYFYDLYESNFHYDPAGAATLGRYPVLFQGEMTISIGLPRLTTQLSLVQIA